MSIGFGFKTSRTRQRGDNGKNTTKNCSMRMWMWLFDHAMFIVYFIEFEIFNNIRLKTKAVCAFANAHNSNCRLSKTNKKISTELSTLSVKTSTEKKLSIAYMCTTDYFKPSIEICNINLISSHKKRFRFEILIICWKNTKNCFKWKKAFISISLLSIVAQLWFYSKIVFDCVMYIEYPWETNKW